MLSGVAARGAAIGEAAERRAIAEGVARLQTAFPELAVRGEADAIVLAGRISREDARLRWIGSLLR
ncbi:hypothetical protein PX554_01490 [Sphingomonas sp. H39-1-10]|uniref:hypothetical protein n=1 Tax=Sphingomonas TaxID=13687 RepID=UPI00088BDB7F|nr:MULTISPECIES: hypothetical protein [Sphingomonas]MDF0486787.1 hypothetical protein [Sphingomonas pollutisoli]SDA35215.1 hypothetical protein SAMN03159340_03194 [Sphingomonas sp. NFR15]